MSKRMEQLLAQKAQLEARIKKQVEKERSREKEQLHRKQVLIGQCVLQQHEASGQTERLAQLMDEFLKSERDRALFGLPQIRNRTE
jgi:primosomal protein N'